MTSATPAPPSRGSLPLGILMGAVVGAIILAIVWFGAGLGDSPTTAAPSPSASGPTPSLTPTPDTSQTPTPTPEDTPTQEPVEGIVTELPTGSWITVLDSLPKASTSGQQAVERAAGLSSAGYTAVALDTDSFPSLTPGYYAIVIPGAATRQGVVDVCQAVGIPLGDRCYPREIKG